MPNTYGRQVVLVLTNKSGGGVVAGDVVVVDTGNNAAFTTTTSGQSTVSLGVAQETIANNGSGRVLISGYAALVNVPASVTRGHYIQTHTVAKQATGNATRQAGSFGQFLTGGTTPTGWLWGFPDNTGSSGAPSDAQYLVGALNGTLSAEKVRADLYKNYSKDNYPTAGTDASTDEFDDASLDGAWAWTSAPGGTVSESAFPGFLNIEGGTDSTPNTRLLLRSYAPGASTAYGLSTKCGTAMENGNFAQQIGIVATDSGNAIIAQILIASDGTATGAKNHRIYFGSSSPTQFASEIFDVPLAAAPRYLRFGRDASNVYRFWISYDDGPGWQYLGTITSSTTVAKIGLLYASDTDAIGENGWWDFVRVHTSDTLTIGA